MSKPTLELRSASGVVEERRLHVGPRQSPARSKARQALQPVDGYRACAGLYMARISYTSLGVQA
jgi:hypothetical protein